MSRLRARCARARSRKSAGPASRPPRPPSRARSRTAASCRADPCARAACRSRSTRRRAAARARAAPPAPARRQAGRTPRDCWRCDTRGGPRAPRRSPPSASTPACARIRSKNSQPRLASVVPPITRRSSSSRRAIGSALISASGETVTPCAASASEMRHQFGIDEDAARVEKDRFESHVEILRSRQSLRVIAESAISEPLPSACLSRSVIRGLDRSARSADRFATRGVPARRTRRTRPRRGPRRPRPAPADPSAGRRTAASPSPCGSRTRRRGPTATPMREQPEPFGHDQAEDPPAVAAERHADADLLAPLRHLVGEHAVDADRGQEQRDAAEQRGQQHRRLAADQRLVDPLLHRLHREERQLRIDRADLLRGCCRRWPRDRPPSASPASCRGRRPARTGSSTSRPAPSRSGPVVRTLPTTPTTV